MKWIKYQIVCNADKNILLNKKLEYTAANLAIAEDEAYDGYTIEEDSIVFEKQPLAIGLGGTGASSAEEARANLGAEKSRTLVTGSGAITINVADYTEYQFGTVSSLTMIGAFVKAHGFVMFGSSAPAISVTGFVKSGGDDIAEAKASETWEFSCDTGFIIWKNWSA